MKKTEIEKDSRFEVHMGHIAYQIHQYDSDIEFVEKLLKK